MRKKKIMLSLILGAVLLLSTGCGGGSSSAPSSGSGTDSASFSSETPSGTAMETEVETTEDPVPAANYEKGPNFTPYQAPPMAECIFDASKAEGDGNKVLVDLSHTEEGYIGTQLTTDKDGVMLVICGETKYQYDVKNDGTTDFFPLQMGDGSYQLHVGEKVDGKMAVLYSANFDVKLRSEFEPFLRPNTYVNYTKDTACVKKAQSLSEKAADENGLIGAVYDFVCASFTYDKEKASTVEVGYIPDLDQIYNDEKGICFDYAAMAAAMLRSQGIPTKMIWGHVSPDGLYHAWNMFYTEETGWVTVEFEVKKDSWNRLDLTFSANGADNTFIGDGSNYVDEKFF